ncbi:hypothetical protein [Protofrankia coriariae]|uniref:hypothetical protein n=1 Tax=Protofrankia coriariae TaxID=1562887 RepID=UPI000AB5BFF0|nr:hypothetical protein [Protofrankia coriariae]
MNSVDTERHTNTDHSGSPGNDQTGNTARPDAGHLIRHRVAHGFRDHAQHRPHPSPPAPPLPAPPPPDDTHSEQNHPGPGPTSTQATTHPALLAVAQPNHESEGTSGCWSSHFRTRSSGYGAARPVCWLLRRGLEAPGARLWVWAPAAAPL